MPHVHVLTNQAHADPDRLCDSVVIVVDVIFATTGLAITLDRGARDVVAAASPDAARAQARLRPADDCVLVGERDGECIEGFAAPWPTALRRADLAGKHVVYSTTNGTVALSRVARAGLTLAAALVNAAAVARYVARHRAGRDIVVLCAGSGSAYSLEDFYGAGCVVTRLQAQVDGLTLSDAAKAAQLLYAHAPAASCVDDTYAGRLMAAAGRGEDLALCRQADIVDVAPLLKDGRLVRG